MESYPFPFLNSGLFSEKLVPVCTALMIKMRLNGGLFIFLKKIVGFKEY